MFNFHPKYKIIMIYDFVYKFREDTHQESGLLSIPMLLLLLNSSFIPYVRIQMMPFSGR